jgi:hypothetical protein
MAAPLLGRSQRLVSHFADASNGKALPGPFLRVVLAMNVGTLQTVVAWAGDGTWRDQRETPPTTACYTASMNLSAWLPKPSNAQLSSDTLNRRRGPIQGTRTLPSACGTSRSYQRCSGPNRWKLHKGAIDSSDTNLFTPGTLLVPSRRGGRMLPSTEDQRRS